jgi:hypothetical protein
MNNVTIVVFDSDGSKKEGPYGKDFIENFDINNYNIAIDMESDLYGSIAIFLSHIYVGSDKVREITDLLREAVDYRD